MASRIYQFLIPMAPPRRTMRVPVGIACLSTVAFVIASSALCWNNALKTVDAQITDAAYSKSPDDPCNTQRMKNIEIQLNISFLFGLGSIEGTAVRREVTPNSRAADANSNQLKGFEVSLTDVKFFPGVKVPLDYKSPYNLRCGISLTSELS